uniref:Zinc finger Ran-binding domain-containing protein 2 n=1 Tax=Timema californicum TaxID=61474 RepID=A0A7R9IVG9_TIMCA|nr:unnamed protein product [Timema californicum]
MGTEKGDNPKKKKLGQEIGKAAAEKSRGLFSADDWQCNKCGNVNWARRQTCNMCNAPRFGEVEERTGYGGGYNDRGVVEYIEREESDDEFDEFGRRKKRKGSSDTDSPVVKKTSGRNEADEDEEEEEEEEDDDDVDLSKYDLSSWGDEDGDESSKPKKEGQTADKDRQREKKRSRSRSLSKSRSKSRSRSRSPRNNKYNNRGLSKSEDH